MRRVDVLLITVLSIGLSLSGCDSTGKSDRPSLSLASSVYVGWMPWFLAAEDGTLSRRAEEHGLDIRFVRGGYLETIHRFADGDIDAVTLTNIDALAFLVSRNVASDAILISSYSHGNDAILLRPQAAGDVTRGPVGLAKFSVSHYLLERYLEGRDIPFDRVQLQDLSDSDIVAVFEDPDSKLFGVVTWNPFVQKIERRLKVRRTFDSRMIEGEIADMLVVRRSVLKRHPGFARALLATWFDMMEKVRGPRRPEILEALGRLAGADERDYEQQLATTLLMKTPEVALGYLRDPFLKDVMAHVQAFVDRYPFVKQPPPKPWTSYPGGAPALLHFNDRPLKDYVGR